MSELHLSTSRVIEERRSSFSESVLRGLAATWQVCTEDRTEKSLRDIEYHLIYLAESIALADPTLFSDYANWAQVLFDGLGFSDQVLRISLDEMRRLLRDELPSQMGEIVWEYVSNAIDQLPAGPSTVPTFLEEDAPLADLVSGYLNALLRGERRVASEIVLDAVDRGVSVKDIYLHVFQPAQYEIGRLWQMNRVSVAQEHYCTAATQLIMSQLYPHIFGTKRVERNLVATCVGRELHEIGVRMVADFFEMEGWDTYYLGANVPTATLLSTLRERKPDVLAISATMTFHVGAVSDVISDVRAAGLGRDVCILVGGYPFKVSPDLWRRIGADGCARDAAGAVALAGRLMPNGA